MMPRYTAEDLVSIAVVGFAAGLVVGLILGW